MDASSRTDRATVGAAQQRRSYEPERIGSLCRSLIEHTTDAVFCYEYDPPISIDLPAEEQVKLLYDATLVMCNDVCARSYGADHAQEMFGKKLTEITKISMESLEKLFTTFVQGGYRVTDGEGVEKLKDGTERYYLSHVNADIENGKLYRVWGTFRDITDVKKKELALKESEEKYRKVVEDQTEFIVRWLPGGIRTFVNDSYCRYFGIKLERAIGTSFFPWITADFREAVKKKIEMLTPQHPVAHGTHQVIRSDGSIGWNQWTDRAIFNDDGKVIEYQSVGRDITDRMLAEEALRKSEERYRSLINNIPDVVWTSDQHGRTSFISSNVEKVYGYTREEIYEQGDKLWFGRIHPDDVNQVKQAFDAAFKDRVPLDIEYRIQRKDGEWIWLHDRSFGAYKMDGVMYADGVFTDITKRKQAEEALKENEKSFRDLSNAAFEGIVFSENGIFVDMNEAFINMFDYSREELQGKSVVELVAPEDRESVLDKIRLGFEGTYEHRGLRKDGSSIDLEVHGRRVIYRGKSMRLTAIRDITERKQAERKLKEYQGQLKSLASEVSLAEERERRRIAVGLHDDIAQKLAMVKLGIQSLQGSVADDDVADSLKKQCLLMDQIIEDAQSLTFELSNPVLYQFGLEAAIESYLIERIQGEFGITCVFTSREPRHQLEEDIRVVLFQATRELLANVVKHAKADKVDVFVDTSGKSAHVVIADNGIGFDQKDIGLHRSEGGGFGLFNVRERLEYLGGDLNIESGPNRGVRITMTVPVKTDMIVE